MLIIAAHRIKIVTAFAALVTIINTAWDHRQSHSATWRRAIHSYRLILIMLMFQSAVRKMKNVYDFHDFVTAVEHYGAMVTKMAIL